VRLWGYQGRGIQVLPVGWSRCTSTRSGRGAKVRDGPHVRGLCVSRPGVGGRRGLVGRRGRTPRSTMARRNVTRFWAPVAVRSVVMKKSSGSAPLGSRTMTRLTWSCGLTRYQRTSRTSTRRCTVWPRASPVTRRQACLLAPEAGAAAFPASWWRGLVEGGGAAHPGSHPRGAGRRRTGWRRRLSAHRRRARPGSQSASSRSIAAACSTVEIVSCLPCRRTLTGSAMG